MHAAQNHNITCQEGIVEGLLPYSDGLPCTLSWESTGWSTLPHVQGDRWAANRQECIEIGCCNSWALPWGKLQGAKCIGSRRVGVNCERWYLYHTPEHQSSEKEMVAFSGAGGVGMKCIEVKWLKKRWCSTSSLAPGKLVNNTIQYL